MLHTKWREVCKSAILSTQRCTSNSSLGSLSNHGRSVILFKRIFSVNTHRGNKRPKLLVPLVFTVGVSVTSFTGCAILQYERIAQQSIVGSMWERLKFNRTKKRFAFREMIKTWWDSLGEGHKIAAGLISINLITFGFWQIRACQPFMRRWFTASPHGHPVSLLLACFSHSEFWHLCANMFVLWSFAPLIQSIMGSEQFAAFYISGGCVSSYFSHCFKIATYSMVPSLGASGALLSVLAACCVKEPESRLSIIFLPFLTFSARTALYGIITFDLCGIILKWKLFDHACHLGGTFFGIWYVFYGRQYTWDKRSPVINQWHRFRKSLENK